MTKKKSRLFQVDTYKCANGEFKELLESKLNEVATHPEWWTTKTEEWEGAYDDYGPPVHTWVLSDRSKKEILAIARTVCPYAEIGDYTNPVTCEADLFGMLCAARPKRYDKITITEEELQSRLCIEDWSYYLSYGLKGWFSWQIDRNRAIDKKRKWKPNFPTEIKFNEDKLRRLYRKAEKLRNIWEWELEIPSQTNLLAMIGIPELVQIAKFECNDFEFGNKIEIPEEGDIDGEALLDAILWRLDEIRWNVSRRHEKPEVHIIFQDPGMHPLTFYIHNLRDLQSTLIAHQERYTRANVTWRDLKFYFRRDIGERDWQGIACLP